MPDANKNSRSAGLPRKKPLRSYGYRNDPVDLEHGCLCWQLPRGVQSNTKSVLRKVAQLRDPGDEDAFLKALPRLTNPLTDYPECRLACDMILAESRAGRPVVVYGDYDCDGVVSVTLMYHALRALGLTRGQIARVIPDRIQDGYGLRWSVLQSRLNELRQRGAKPGLVIAVDCGSAHAEAARCILEEGMRLIIVDHHQPNVPLPDSDSLIHLNPKLWMNRPERRLGTPLEEMCAGGLTYLLVQALMHNQPNSSSKWFRPRALLLAGLATCADVVRLTGINRVLLKYALKVANNPWILRRVPGLFALHSRLQGTATMGGRITEDTFAFYWAPVINAAGRVQKATPALKMLQSAKVNTARRHVTRCLNLNGWRKAIEKAMVCEAFQKIEDRGWGKNRPPVIVVVDPRWHPGVVGIVAARIKERYNRPVLVGSLHRAAPTVEAKDGTKTDTPVWRASGRSIPGFDLGKALHQAKECGDIRSGGGHALAGGAEFTDAQLAVLPERLASSFASQAKKATTGKPSVDTFASASQFSPNEWATIFENLRPFGSGNPRLPLLVEAAELLSVQTLVRTLADPLDRRDTAQDKPQRGVKKASGTQQRQGEFQRSYWLVRPGDVRSPELFLRRMARRRDAVSEYLVANFRKTTLEAIEKLEESPKSAPSLLPSVLDDLNELMTSKPFYEIDRYEGIRLQKQTKLLLEQGCRGNNLVQLNRHLLEDAYPGELRRLRGRRPPKVQAYEGHFEDLTTGRHFFAQWLDVESAEVTWDVHRFIPVHQREDEPVTLPTYFRLQLELRAYLSPQECSKYYQGILFQWDHFFQVKQCIRISRRETREELSMRTVRA